jgi:hypothetical protein
LGFYLWLKDDQLLCMLIRSVAAEVGMMRRWNPVLMAASTTFFLVLYCSGVKGFDNGILFFEGAAREAWDC